jgi:hypothetical protein
MDNATRFIALDAARLRALLDRHQGTFLAEHPDWRHREPFLMRAGQVWYRPEFALDSGRWLRARGYLSREEFLHLSTLLRQVQDQIHNHQQWEG